MADKTTNHLPKMTDEQRVAALAKAARTRSERAALRAALKSRELRVDDLFAKVDAGDPAASGMRVEYMLRSMPAYGLRRAQALEESLGLKGTRRLSGLGSRQREALVAALGGN